MATNTSTAASESTAADDGTDDRMTAVQKLREQADAVVERIQPQIAAVSTYVRDEPTKALAHLGRRRRGADGPVRPDRPLERPLADAAAPRPAGSAMAAIRDAALDLADSAQSMALDALEATQKRAAAPTRPQSAHRRADNVCKRAPPRSTRRQERAAAAADSVAESAADAWKKVRDQAAPVVEKIKPQIDAAAAYAKEDPARTALGLAAAGAIIAGLIALARHSEDDSLS